MKREYYLSWDCGMKALAYTYFSINIEVLQDIRGAHGDISAQIAIMDGAFEIYSANVIDILGEGVNANKTSDVMRARCLKKVLEEHMGPLSIHKDTHVLIEHQSEVFRQRMAAHTRAIEQQLVYHYSDYDVIQCNAGDKNRVAFSRWLERWRWPKGYAGNKKHSQANFVALCHRFGLRHHFSLVKRKDLDDIADTVMQALGYMKRKKILVL